MSGGEGFYNTVNYVGTRRGRSRGGDFGHEMFPEKYEATNMEEDPEQMDDNWRNTLMDLSPDAPTYAHEMARRNPYSRDFINLRDGGARVNTDPWQNEDYDTQMHDKDPRGWSTEQPWQEYRRVVENKMSNIDFKDDGDYSVPSQGIHPNTMYKAIRGAQNWTKSRMKWFATAKDGWHNGGTGKYKFSSPGAVGFTDVEDTSSMVDPRYMEAEGRMDNTTNLSNIVNTGSKFIRANTTTDQTAKVAGYGKLYKQRGLMKHESQVRNTADDRQMSKVEGMQSTPANLVALMASGSRGGTAAKSARLNLQGVIGSKGKFNGVSEQQDTNRSRKLTNDVMSLLGFTPMEMKWVKEYSNKNRKAGKHMQAQLMELTEMVHAMPAHMKLTMRDELMMSSLGKGLSPADPTQMRRARDNAIINPKIVKFMDLMVRGTEKPGDPEVVRRMGWGDPENQLKGIFANGQLFSTRGQYLGEGDVDANRRSTTGDKGMARGKWEERTKSYSSLARNAANYQKNRQDGINAQELQDTMSRILGKNLDINKTHNMNRNHTSEDNDFGENLYKDRRGGRMGSKYMRRFMDDDANDNDDWEDHDMREHGHLERSSNKSVRVNG